MSEHAELLVAELDDCINGRDLDGLATLLTEDHAFIDSAGAEIRGRTATLRAWRRFFDAFPDYRSVFRDVRAVGDRVAIVGHSTCSDRRLHGPALWTATIRGDRIAEWRVHEDTPTNRERLGIGDSRPDAPRRGENPAS